MEKTSPLEINSQYLKISTVYTAELAAVAIAISILPSYSHVEIFTDSEPTINHLRCTKTLFLY